MKIAITGHTKGIGKACIDLFDNSHKCVGFSRSNGFDIDKNITSIVRASKDCDVFVNNAFNYHSQIKMFQEIFEAWQNDSTKTIINIGSRTKYYPVGATNSPDYTREKRALHDVVENALFYSKKKCRVITINPGYVDTEMTKGKTAPMLSANKIAETIEWCIKQPQDVEIGELSIWVT